MTVGLFSSIVFVLSAPIVVSILSGLLSSAFLVSLDNKQTLLNSTSRLNPEEYLAMRDREISSVPVIARQVTVRIISSGDAGSGVIVKRQGQTYTVLTNHHVLAFNADNRYRVLTADGNTHSGQWKFSVDFGNRDLALLEFTSNNDYQVVELGDSNTVSVGDLVYAAGFPNWAGSSPNSRRPTENTRDWGERAYELTTGRVKILLELSLARGYQMGYNNNIQNGMSGGPVLDRRGRLIGINGRAKYPVAGINAYRFEDGSLPSADLYRDMEVLSWAIPVATFKDVIERSLDSLSSIGEKEGIWQNDWE
ncbi:S1 family peptidase [Phormidium sp. CCY1219]|uniref:S1 family peptidase n=1 Tax=Phormidium sp. CCY1219 TaxID=2886104 RepID=UPI002D1F7C39|nr:serine protease [Phormidium sp. CCY1219]MEB3830009.1 serine protease [Phormidium sp. CCY1219]